MIKPTIPTNKNGVRLEKRKLNHPVNISIFTMKPTDKLKIVIRFIFLHKFSSAW